MDERLKRLQCRVERAELLNKDVVNTFEDKVFLFSEYLADFQKAVIIYLKTKDFKNLKESINADLDYFISLLIYLDWECSEIPLFDRGYWLKENQQHIDLPEPYKNVIAKIRCGRLGEERLERVYYIGEQVDDKSRWRYARGGKDLPENYNITSWKYVEEVEKFINTKEKEDG